MRKKIGYSTYRIFLRETLDLLKDLFGHRLLAVALFGSVARKQARPDSDIDLLIVHKDVDFCPMKTFVERQPLLRKGKGYKHLKVKGLDPYLSPVFLTERDLWERPLILLDVLDHGRILYDTGVLKRRLRMLQRRLRELGAKRIALPDGSWYWDLKPDWKPGEVIIL